MLSEPAAWRRLLTKLATVQADYLLAQARAGAQALQVFDSWAGRALGREDYLRYVAPHNRELFAAIARADVPVINFSLGTSAYLEDAAAAAGTWSGSTGSCHWTRRGRASASSGPCRGTSTLPRCSRRGVSFARGSTTYSTAQPAAGTCLQSRSRHRPADNRRQRPAARRARARADVDVTPPVGVLVMAYGGPESLEEIPGYLADIRGGRVTPREVVVEITENYRAIGGRSPLLEATRAQVDALQAALGEDYRCYLGMRHWSPWIEDVVGEMAADGIEQRRRARAGTAVQLAFGGALPAARRRRPRSLPSGDRVRARPQLSRRSRPDRGLRRARARGSLPLAGGRALARAARLHGAQPPRARARERRPVRRAVPRDRAPRRPSAPGSTRRAGPGVTSRPGAHPSRGRGLISASISEELAARGIRDVVVVPVGFVSDHVEILFDVDVRAAPRRRAAGDEARTAAGVERRPRVRRGARGARAGSDGAMKVVVVGGGIAGLAAARRARSIDPERRGRAAGAVEARREDPHEAGRRLPDRGRGRQLPLAQGAGSRPLRGARARRAS